MNLDKIAVGPNPPQEINVVVEVPSHWSGHVTLETSARICAPAPVSSMPVTILPVARSMPATR